jgi:hypothetical protein
MRPTKSSLREEIKAVKKAAASVPRTSRRRRLQVAGGRRRPRFDLTRETIPNHRKA